MNTRRTITEVEAERIADMRIHRALDRDPRYLHAEDAEARAQAEDNIEAEVWARIDAEFNIACGHNDESINTDGAVQCNDCDEIL